MLDRFGLVQIDEHKIRNIDPADLRSIATHYEHLLDPRSDSRQETCFDFILNAALNGGYYTYHRDGTIAQWTRDGSSSEALRIWIRNLHKTATVPGRDILSASELLTRLGPSLQELPYATKRTSILLEFADRSRRDRLEALLDSAYANYRHSWSLRHSEALGQIYPSAFGEYPFRKKAALAWLLIAGRDRHCGIESGWNHPIPTDYQMPRIFAYEGLLIGSDAVRAELSGDHLLDPYSPAVMSTRAATALTAELIAERLGIPSYLVDAIYFQNVRSDPEFLTRAQAPMRIDGDWF